MTLGWVDERSSGGTMVTLVQRNIPYRRRKRRMHQREINRKKETNNRARERKKGERRKRVVIDASYTEYI